MLSPPPVTIPGAKGAASLRRAARYLVGNYEIAARTGMRRDAVSWWRSRYSDFPRPLVTQANGRIYDWRAVRVWLVARGISWALDDC